MFTRQNKSFIVVSHVGVKASWVFVSYKLSRVSNRFTLHACYCCQGCISKVPLGKQPWRNVGLAVSIGWSKDQVCCDKNATAPGSQALKTWIPSIPLPLVLECLTPSDVWHLMKGVRKASGTSAVTSLFLLSAAHHHVSSMEADCGPSYLVKIPHVCLFLKNNQQTDSLLRCDASKDPPFIVYIIKHRQYIVCEVSPDVTAASKELSSRCIKACNLWWFCTENIDSRSEFLGGDGEITDEEETRLLTENKEEHMEICRCLVLPSFKAHIIVHNAAEEAPRSGQLLKRWKWGVCLEEKSPTDWISGVLCWAYQMKDNFCRTRYWEELAAWTNVAHYWAILEKHKEIWGSICAKNVTKVDYTFVFFYSHCLLCCWWCVCSLFMSYPPYCGFVLSSLVSSCSVCLTVIFLFSYEDNRSVTKHCYIDKSHIKMWWYVSLM